MKTIITIILVSFLCGCTSHTAYGPCIGVADEKNPNLVYKISAWNLIVGIFFFSLVAPPVVVLVDEFYCPVGYK